MTANNYRQQIKIGTQVDIYPPGWGELDPPMVHRCTVTEIHMCGFHCRLGKDTPLVGPLWDTHPGFRVWHVGDGLWETSIRGEFCDAYIIGMS